MHPLVDGLGARVELALAQTQLKNALNYLRQQWRQHLVNGLAIGAALLVLWWQAAPKTYSGAWRAYAHWALPLVCGSYFLLLGHRLRTELHRLSCDWLSVQPIPTAARLRWLRTRTALRTSIELLVLSFLQAQLFGSRSGAALLLIGAVGSVLLIQLIPVIRLPAFAAPAADQARYASTARPALQAWFYSEILGAARLRWWWLVVALMVPMSSSLIAIAALALLVAAALRAYAVLHACAQTLYDLSRLLHSQPVRPRMLYRAALSFVARALVPSIAVLCLLLALACRYQGLSLWLVPVGLLLAMLLAGTALHFAFAYRHTPLSALRRARAATLCAIALALLLQMLAPLVPLLCVALWRFHYLRGLRALESR